ncbi:hypothetical protein EUA67_03520 [TM7 phylum sp. oral taxon 352]|nr:hypothetical protein EUA67_03520 [TM7 phylum sp. oral taxon 352]TWP25584.1 hypothetical protein EUA59_00210 [TM7 phylum sp. oral taxon 346]
MKRYKLLKDLPNLKKGTILSEGEPIFGVRTLITKNNSVGPTFIGNELFEEFFEEIQEEPTDSIHWKPRIGDRCFILANANIRPTSYTGMLRDYNAWRTGKVFRTEEECEKALDRELAEVRLRRTSTFKPGFKNGNGGWIIGYDHYLKELTYDSIDCTDYGEPVRYETEEEAKKSIKENREDWLIYFGIEEEI